MNKRVERSGGRGAFTLVELLVVIGVIAVLVAMLLPALNKARQQSRTTVCMSYLRQIGNSFQMYMIENKGHMMPYYNDNNTATPDGILAQGQILWEVDLLKYGTSAKSLLCPEAQEPNPLLDKVNTTQFGTCFSCWGPHGKSVGEYQFGSVEHLGRVGSYGMNSWLYRLNVPGNATPGDSTVKGNDGGADAAFWVLPVHNSFEVPLVGDSIWQDGLPKSNDFCADSLFNGDTTSGRTMGRWTIARHKKTINMCFLDGHVANIRLPQLWSLKWSRFDPTHASITTWPATPPTNNPDMYR